MKEKEQIQRHIVEEKNKLKKKRTRITVPVISTGSTLLDLAISGGMVRGGGMPGGILVEIFGPSGSGKTVLLCEIAGAVQRAGGKIMFQDPEGRLNKQYATIFGAEITNDLYHMPNTVTELFSKTREFEGTNGKINGVFADSLAALSTELEMGSDEGDKMGARRAKEFSEQLRRTCRVLATNGHLMVCSNQIRENIGAGIFATKYKSPGGEAIGFYSSLRLRFSVPKKIKAKAKIAGKDIEKIIGVETEIEVFKSSIWKPFRKALVTILFDYGVDDIRQNLQYVKDHTSNNMYMVFDRKLSRSIDKAIQIIEEENLEHQLKEQVIALWEMIESEFKQERKQKQR